MSDLIVARAEPIYLVPEGPARLTEYGKGWMDRTLEAISRFKATISDVLELGKVEKLRWPAIERKLALEGVPTNISSGMSQYLMSHLLDHSDGKTSFTMPAAVAMALLTAAPTSTSTGSSGITEAAYTGYARQTLAGSVFNAATAATPSVVTNATAVTFGNCTASTSTLLGFLLTDSATLATGNALWYGTLTSTVISVTQTPPTVAIGALSLQINGT
jgi:hypothetical protein